MRKQVTGYGLRGTMIGDWKNKGLTSHIIRRQCNRLISLLSTAKRHWHQFAYNISRARCNMSSSSQSSGGSLMISEGGRCAKKPSRGRPRNGVHSLLMTPYLHSNPVCGATDCYSTCLTSCLEKSHVQDCSEISHIPWRWVQIQGETPLIFHQ